MKITNMFYTPWSIGLNWVNHPNAQENEGESKTSSKAGAVLTHIMPLVSFYTPWDHQETSDFLFSGGIGKRPVGWNGFIVL